MGALLMLATMSPARAEKNLVRPPGTTRYGAMVRELRDLGQWDQTRGYHRVALSTIGESVKGREIWMVTLHDPRAVGTGKKIFYLCRQHGHEPASTEGALKFIDELVHAAPSSNLDQCLQRTIVYIVPMANPDGAEAFLRHNAHDVDLNRDWLKRTQPETRSWWRAIQRIHPDLITDQHELYPTDRRPDFTETAGPKAGAPASTIAVCVPAQQIVHLAMTADGYPNRSYWIDSPHAPRLAHRFGCIVAGIPTILFETNRSSHARTVADRGDAHEQFMRIILRDVAGEQDTLLSEAYKVLGNKSGLIASKARPTSGPPAGDVNTPVLPSLPPMQPGSGEENEGQ
jgi:hypothetical protein